MKLHTLTPWAVTATKVAGAYARTLNESVFKCFGPDAEANAAHIVKCVNQHDALVAALQMIATFPTPAGEAIGSAVTIARQALANASEHQS